MMRRIPLLLVFVVSTLTTGGCGYTLIKQSTLREHRLPADSMQIMTLQSQIATLQAEVKADSARYVTLKAVTAVATAPVTPTPEVPDSVLRAKDQEIQTLKDQITELSAELDRIKKRLASPKP